MSVWCILAEAPARLIAADRFFADLGEPYASLDTGFWREAGFDVTFLKGEGSATTVAGLRGHCAGRGGCERKGDYIY